MQPRGARAIVFSTVKRFAVALIAVSTAGLVVTQVARFVPIWPCVLIDHFVVQLLVGGIAVTAAAAALRVRSHFDVAAIVTLLYAISIARDLCVEPVRVLDGGQVIRVLLLNVHTSSTSYAEVGRLIEDVDPDIVGLVEVDRRWIDALAGATSRFAGRIEHPRDDNFGVALYSREAFTGTIEYLGSTLPTASASVSVDGAKLSVMLTHPIPPVSSEQLASQQRQLAEVARRARQLDAPVVVMGDLNATPWSAPFRDFIARSGLCDSRAGFGIQASFPAASAILRIPIDHVLTSCNVGVSNRWIERDVGSDHLPVVVEIVVPR